MSTNENPAIKISKAFLPFTNFLDSVLQLVTLEKDDKHRLVHVISLEQKTKNRCSAKSQCYTGTSDYSKLWNSLSFFPSVCKEVVFAQIQQHALTLLRKQLCFNLSLEAFEFIVAKGFRYYREIRSLFFNVWMQRGASFSQPCSRVEQQVKE